jgi:Flp pilus assembly protein TadD
VGLRYEIRGDAAAAEASALAREMDLRFEVYNRLFRFDPSRLAGKLRVRSFADKAAYDAYVGERLGSVRDGAVYLHYNQADKCELIVNRQTQAADKLFAHQAFIQFLRAFVPNPPTWMRDGFAVYFSTLDYDRKADELVYEENLAWLPTVKGWAGDAPSLESVLFADLDPADVDSGKMQGASWALVSFLLNAEDEDYRRTLFESFMALSPTASARDNTQTVAARAGPWIDPEAVVAEYQAYVASRRTFAELVEAGRSAYGAKNGVLAEQLFLGALDLKPEHYAPYYYLGLLAYEKKDLDMAENHYRSALQYGADTALVNYALGLNAVAQGSKENARAYLQKAAGAAPDRYRTKVQELLERLK